MIEGKTLQELTVEVDRQQKAKRDYRADTRKLGYERDGTITMELAGGPRRFMPTRLCQEQIAGRVGIPQKYFDRMRTEAPGLLAANVNHWFQNAPEQRMLRTLDNGGAIARAFLSDRYRPLDNAGLMGAVLPELANLQAEVRSAEITERRLYIQVVTPRIERVIARINRDQHVALKDGPDIVQAGLVISNSEVGCGSIRVQPMVYRLACLNGLIVASTLNRHHVGRGGNSGGSDEDSIETLLSDEAREADDRAFWLKVRDVVRASVNEVEFAKTCSRLEEATQHDLGNPVEVVELAGERLGLTSGEQESVLRHFCMGGDLSQYGLLNAVTRTAEDADGYDRAIELERMGGQILELPPTDFRKN